MGTTTQQFEHPAAAPLELVEEKRSSSPVPSDRTPPEFYAEITKRADVRAILEGLANSGREECGRRKKAKV